MSAVVIDGVLVSSEEAKLSATSPGVMYGFGIFETLKYVNKKVELFSDHMKRFREAAHKIGLCIERTDPEIEKDCLALIDHFGEECGVIKISAIKEEKTRVIISGRKFIYTPDHYKRGFSVSISEVLRNQTSNLVGIKSDNYLENILELEKARNSGHDEVLFFNTEGYLAEGSFTNIFFVKDQKLFTPEKKCGLLVGVMRNQVIKVAFDLGIEVIEGKFTKLELGGSEEAFLTNSVMGIMPIKRIEEKHMPVFGACTKMLYDELKNRF
ncbi:aminotransferase class IV [Alkalibacter mobilis]|uniref:aminotransferase class IV n=1 Tax=Alkalibacter mobilis TaxID=2787712 RepID=UPI00189DB32C|nr:aminotransferase class IV [Alkalibacter mobilis]MBF7096958.1 aminotransferase class IV [Alkalibacter mobilis]